MTKFTKNKYVLWVSLDDCATLHPHVAAKGMSLTRYFSQLLNEKIRDEVRNIRKEKYGDGGKE